LATRPKTHDNGNELTTSAVWSVDNITAIIIIIITINIIIIIIINIIITSGSIVCVIQRILRINRTDRSYSIINSIGKRGWKSRYRHGDIITGNNRSNTIVGYHPSSSLQPAKPRERTRIKTEAASN
jgi:hypothetical protein